MTTPATLMTTYGRAPVAFVKGEGCYLVDSEGKRYLDAVAGVAVNALGHSHPGFISAVQQQVATLVHTSNLYRIPLQEQLSAELCRRSGMEQVFFCNSGAEAIEASLKLARKVGHARGLKLPTILVFEGAFHGRTLGALTATHSPKYQEGFTPLLEGFVRVPYNDIPAVEAALAANPEICAILAEPIQGEGGVKMPARGFVKALRELCDKHNALLILDEIQTGNGRTGKWFACQHEDVRPDIMATAKGLGNGFPIGACLAAGPAANVFQPGHHGSTFGGSPLACAAGLAVYEALEKEDLCANAERMGNYLLERFRRELADVPGVREIRGQGLMIGIELDKECSDLGTRAREQGVLVNIASGNTIRMVPPLVLTQTDADLLAATVVTLVQEFCHGR